MNTFSAFKDDNGTPTLMVTRNDDGVFPMTPYSNPTTHHLLVEDGTTGSQTATNNAVRDNNAYPVMIAVSSTDFKTPVPVFGDFSTGAILVQST